MLNETPNVLFLLFAILAIGIIFIIMWIISKWFPVTDKLRINSKRKGAIIFYRAEAKRPIFGWTAFWVYGYSGIVQKDNEWTSRKGLCEDCIVMFKRLKPLK